MSSHSSAPPVKQPSPIYFRGPFYHQSFTLPDSITFHITKNPSTSKLYQKLIKTCKFFFHKNPIIVLQCLHYYDNQWQTCLKRCKVNPVDCQKFGFNKITTKFWINQIFDHLTNRPFKTDFIPPSILPKIFRSDVKFCFLLQQKLTIKELLFFTSKAEGCHFKDCIITADSDGSIVQIETIVSCLTKVTVFYTNVNPDASNISFNSVKSLLKISHFSKIHNFYLYDIPETFDIESMYEYLKSTNKNFFLNLIFRDTLSPSYMIRLQAFAKDILETYSSAYAFPHIYIPNLNHVQKYALSESFRKYMHYWKFPMWNLK